MGVGVSLSGCSGAGLEIVRRGERGWVRKTAAEGGTDRLLAERAKLAWLRGVGGGPFVVPELGAVGERAGREWYELAYVPGRSVESVAAEDGQAAGRALGARLAGVVWAIGDAGVSPGAGEHAAFLEQKVRQTLSVLPGKCAGAPLLEGLRVAFEVRVARVDFAGSGDAAGRAGGGCHGDLALDNVLVGRGGELVLIDALPNASESVYWDAAKVLQSTLACWGSVKIGDVVIGGGGLVARRPGGLAALHGSFLGAVLGGGLDERALAVHLVVTLARVMRYVDGVRLAALLAASVELMDRLEAGGARLHEPLDSLRGSFEPVLDGGAEVSARDAGWADDAGARGGVVRRVG